MTNAITPFVVMESAPARNSPWVRGPLWDSVWMLNAVWLLPLALWLSRGDSGAATGPLDVLYFAVTALFWIGHRLSSTWLAYCTDAYRPLLRCEPVRFVVLPALITAACFAFILPADHALPWPRADRVVALAILDYALVTHHFAAQHFGALSLYRSRAERAACARTRQLDRLFALGAGGVLIFVADVMAGSVVFQELWIDRWLVPGWLAAHQDQILGAARWALFAITALILVAETRAKRRSLPRVLYILGLAAMIAVALQPRSLFLFVMIWTSQHWILAVGLASQVPGGATAPGKGAVRRALHALNARPWALLLVLILVSLLFLPFFEVEAVGEEETFYGDRIFGAFAEGLRASSWVPMLVALGFATGFLHYLLDRSLYRMSDPRVRAAASNLLNRA
jgi:hypothetical protein